VNAVTEREKEILDIIRKDPMISQKDIAERLGITRSSVAVHIANLMKKGAVKGKGYVLDDEIYVTVIGGCNMDISGSPYGKLSGRDSNPGSVTFSPGGVGRNIAENLARLGLPVKLISVVGDDESGRRLLEETRASGVDVSHIRKLTGEATGIYLSVLDEDKDMYVAVSSMEIYDKLDTSYLLDKMPILERSRVSVFDANLSYDVIETALGMAQKNMKYLDTVSITKALRIKELIGRFDCIKPNRIEAEALSGISAEGNSGLLKNADHFHELGVSKVFISLGPDGTFFSDGTDRGICRALRVDIRSATGAGDAFLAGAVYAETEGLDIRDAAIFGTGASLINLASGDTINKNTSVESIKKIMEENYEIKRI
jgi:pseudouridine kinase